MKAIVSGLFLLVLSIGVQAAVQSKAVEYKDGETALTGYLYCDDATKAHVPACW
jgi:hypothetical protein